MKKWKVNWPAGGILQAQHPDKPECLIEMNTHKDLEAIGRYFERKWGLQKAEFPNKGFRIVRVE